MPNPPGDPSQNPTSVPDLTIIIEQLQDQLDDLTAAMRAMQTQLDRQAARITALERS